MIFCVMLFALASLIENRSCIICSRAGNMQGEGGGTNTSRFEHEKKKLFAETQHKELFRGDE